MEIVKDLKTLKVDDHVTIYYKSSRKLVFSKVVGREDPIFDEWRSDRRCWDMLDNADVFMNTIESIVTFTDVMVDNKRYFYKSDENGARCCSNKSADRSLIDVYVLDNDEILNSIVINQL